MADKPTTNFGEVDAASAIARAKQARVPVGGVPMPAVPRLDQRPADRNQGVQTIRGARRVLTPEQQESLAAEGKLHQGVGSAYVANQPMAHTVEVSTDPNDPSYHEIDPKLIPRPPGAGLRKQTVQDLEALAAANAAAKKSEEDAELAKINREIEEIDEQYETDEFGERRRSLLQNKKRKDAIESRCQPMDFTELLMQGSVQQKVPIIPEKFLPTFRSLQGDENLEIKRLMGQVRGPDQYVLDTFSLYNLTAGLHALNGRVLPNHLDKSGDFNEDLFKAKFKYVTKMAIPILADLSVNFEWFAQRVQKLTVIDDIKGF